MNPLLESLDMRNGEASKSWISCNLESLNIPRFHDISLVSPLGLGTSLRRKCPLSFPRQAARSMLRLLRAQTERQSDAQLHLDKFRTENTAYPLEIHRKSMGKPWDFMVDLMDLQGFSLW